MDINKEEIKKAQDKIATYQKEKRILEGNIIDLNNENELSLPLQYGLKAMRKRVNMLNAQIKICEDMIETLKKIDNDGSEEHFTKVYTPDSTRAWTITQQAFHLQNRGYKIKDVSIAQNNSISIEYIKENK